MTLNGHTISWREEGDLPEYCGACPFWFGGETSAPVPACHETGGICNLREMSKDRYADAPKACRNLFRKCLKFPDDARLVIILKD